MKNIFLLGLILSVLSCTRQAPPNMHVKMEKTIDSLLQQMTLEEKIHMLHASSSFTSGGVERLGIPELVMSDGPHGVRHEHGRDWTIDDIHTDSVSYLPVGIALASTWNTSLGHAYGTVLGSEAKARGKDMILGPGINIIRTPVCGRNFEYLSEDPYLSAQMAVGYIQGVQEQEVSACAKHFVANNQEEDRSSVDVELSERALHEIYLPAFKAAVQEADVYAVMGAYNKVWGQHCAQHSLLLNEILKKDFGFSGLVVSDWAAVHDTKEALLNGCDIEMGTDLTMLPDPDYSRFYLADSAFAMVQRGEVDEEVVNDKVRRILRVMYKTKHFSSKRPGEVNTPAHHQLALQVAEEGIVLLKNEEQLPFDNGQEQLIAVIGDNAQRKHAEEGGSSQVKTLYEITPLQGIRAYATEHTQIAYAQGYAPTRKNTLNQDLLDEAVKLAEKADRVIFVGGWIHNFDAAEWGKDAFDSEGLDKKDLKLRFGQEELIHALARANPNITVVIMGGSNVEMLPWLDEVPAIVQAWYPGMEGGNALANILFGQVNPSGKLPMSFAATHKDYAAHQLGEYPGKDLSVHYKDDIYVGYRYFESYDVPVVFPFGHGLSYTSFQLDQMQVKETTTGYQVSCSLHNTGERAGAEVVQLYIGPKEVEVERPAKELKAFQKVYLESGASQNIQFDLPLSAFQYYNGTSHAWEVAQGSYRIMLGNSVAHLPLEEKVTIN